MDGMDGHTWDLFYDRHGRPRWRARARATPWSTYSGSHASDGLRGASYFDSTLSSSAVGVDGTYWSPAEEEITTAPSSVYAYPLGSGRDTDTLSQPRPRYRRHGRRSASRHFESDRADTRTVWSRDDDERRTRVSTDDGAFMDYGFFTDTDVFMGADPMMTGALPVSEREPRSRYGSWRDTEFTRGEKSRRSKSSTGHRHSHHEDLYERHRERHHERQHGHRNHFHYDHPHSHHTIHNHYNHAQPTTPSLYDNDCVFSVTSRSPSVTLEVSSRPPVSREHSPPVIQIVRVEEDHRSLDERDKRHHGKARDKENLAMKFVKYAAGGHPNDDLQRSRSRR